MSSGSKARCSPAAHRARSSRSFSAHDIQSEGGGLEHARRHRQSQRTGFAPRLRRNGKISQRKSQHDLCFPEIIAEGVARTKSDPAAAQRAIGKFTQTDDRKVIDETYDFYAPSWVTSLALRPEQFQTWFGYLDDTEYPLVKKAEPKDFYDNSFGES